MVVESSPDRPSVVLRLILLARWAVFCTVFYAIPILFVCSWFGQVWAEEEEQRKTARIRSVERVVANILSHRETRNFFSDLLRRLAAKVFSSPDPERTFRRYRAHLDRRFPGLFEYKPGKNCVPEHLRAMC